MQNYINNIIKTGIANGLSKEEILKNPKKAAKAYLEAQLKSIDKAGKLVLETLS